MISHLQNWLTHPGGLVRRLSNSTVVWSWAFNFLRLASGVLLLPLLLLLLSKPDLGMYYVFLSLNGIILVLDLGFSPSIGRFIGYAMGGAKRLKAFGMVEDEVHGEPNRTLLWELLLTGRIFYRFVAVAAAVLLGLPGSLMVMQKVGETSSPQLTWVAWGVSVAAVAAETYFNVWNVFLRSINQVLTATRISMLAYFLRLVLACILLWAGWGLLSLPAASLATSLIIRHFSRHYCLKALAACPRPEHVDWRAHFRIIWPNSWRLGLYFAGAYLSTNGNVLLCSGFLGLAATANYGLSLQIINIVSGMAAVWTHVKWPLIGQLVAKQNIETLRRLLWPRLWLQMGTYVVLATGAIVFGPFLVRLVGSDKELLPAAWLVLLAVNGLLEAHCSVWNTLISMWNELPMLWPSLATNAVSLGLNLLFVQLPGAHAGLLVLGPLLASAALNYWFWPRYGARMLKLSWFGFLRYGFASGFAGSR
jgi:O-antigen/teichoic acid export membrane protein